MTGSTLEIFHDAHNLSEQNATRPRFDEFQGADPVDLGVSRRPGGARAFVTSGRAPPSLPGQGLPPLVRSMERPRRSCPGWLGVGTRPPPVDARAVGPRESLLRSSGVARSLAYLPRAYPTGPTSPGPTPPGLPHRASPPGPASGPFLALWSSETSGRFAGTKLAGSCR